MEKGDMKRIALSFSKLIGSFKKAGVVIAIGLMGSSLAQAAAPETTISGPNNQQLRILGVLGGGAMALNGDVEAEISVASVHQGSNIGGRNDQRVDWIGGNILGLDFIGGVAAGAIAGDACAKMSVGSVGSSTCSQGDVHMSIGLDSSN